MPAHIRKGDVVFVRSGSDKGKTGAKGAPGHPGGPG